MNPDPDEHVHPGEEELEWGEGISIRKREKKPQSKYWAISEQARKMFPGERQCKMFCGGKNCKYCTSDNWTQKEMVINGLYSQWVTDNILAMARMSDSNIDRFKFLEQFEKLGIQTIINLQEPGEHAHCGAGNGPGGFSYDPQRLMAAKLFFYNFVMKDYGVAPMSTLLDTVKVLQFSVSVGRIAVHCHAGLGRTGLIIACYLIYNNRVSARKAIQYVRSRRPGSIQTKQQVTTCHEFEQYLKVYFIVFTSKTPDAHPVSFSRFLVRQRQLLHGYEARKLKHIPKVVYVCCERLLELCGKGQALTSLRDMPIDSLPEDFISQPGGESAYSSQSRDAGSLDQQCDHQILRQSRALNLSVWDKDGDPRERAHTLTNTMSRVDSLKAREFSGLKESLSSSRINDIKNTDSKALGMTTPLSRSLRSLDVSPVPIVKRKSLKKKSYLGGIADTIEGKDAGMRDFHDNGRVRDGKSFGGYDVNTGDDNDDDSIMYQQTEEEYEQAKLHAAREIKKAEEEEVKIYAQKTYLQSVTQSLSACMTTQDVCEAAIEVNHSATISERIESYKERLNKSHEGWQALAMEKDPAVICGLMSDWLDHLNEPVLRIQDITSIIGNHSNAERAFLGLETSTKYFLEYIVVVLSKLDPVTPGPLCALVELLLSKLCQQRLGLDHISWATSAHDTQRGHSRPDYADELFYLFLDLISLERKKQ